MISAFSIHAGLRLTSTETINNLYILGRIYWIREEFTKAIEYASKSHNAAVESLGIDDDDTVKARLLLENICRRQRDFKYLINFRKDVLQRYNSAFGPLDARTLNVQNELLLAYHEAGEFAQSLDLGEELLRHLGDAGVEDNRLKYAKRKQGMGLAIVWKLRDGRGLEPPRSDLARAIYLLEDALHMDESQGVEDPKVILQQLRMLRDLYIIIKDWMKALDRGRLAVRKSVELHGAYSKDALDDRDELLQLELHRGYTREVFDVALDIYHNCVAIHGYDSDRTLVAVMGLHKLLNDIGAGEEDRINVFNLLWTTFLNIETLGGRKQRLEREIILPALEELEASAPPSEKCRMKEIKDLHILINETSPEENHDTTMKRCSIWLKSFRPEGLRNGVVGNSESTI
ncbi:hypothetical protein CC78DRAFT_81187 [Lojkania enalia]|uniref:Uncharacterized protein n=1 Tax=Lojkania enalia TaxID=147567 RepID=A0A9P4N5A7_9PLEO|nr:hypothetical protein CC78DRAFT_81187 [Didymosphaeria enalia]